MRPSPSPRGPSPLVVFLLLLFLLRGLRPVFGNEGGTAGSCACKRWPPVQTPVKLDRLIHRVKSWDECQDSSQRYVRFIFQNFSLCIPTDQPEVKRWKEVISQKANARADASKGGQGPPTGTPKAQPDIPFRTEAPPTSKGPPTAQPDPRFLTDALQMVTGPQQEETPTTLMPSEPPFTPGAAVGRPGRPPTPQQGPAPSQPAPRGSSSPSHTTLAIVSLLGIALVLVAVVVSLVCRRRRRRRQEGPLHPAALGEETHWLNLPEKT
nr:PREDICTED: C-X-C motif chemokine 16 [Anolis carolinensis]|eukprot:XP_008123195.1 PREDICTED: C-X-C motif chemokine 16 [Anolis carolinensis]